tara:strand:+ start:558 stop:1118 length:561 start_codon:yes stop_codon:yes gene_type:complete
VYKRKVREIFISRRNLINSKILEDSSIQIAKQSLKLEIWHFTNYHIFFPIEKNKEVNTKHIIQIIQGKDKNVIVPKIKDNTNLKNYLLTDSTLFVKNSYGISEPQSGIEVNPIDFDLIFIPLIAFDQMGYRVGYGKGYYDKMLSQCSKKALKVGLSLFDPINKIHDISTHDVKMDYCITPDQIYKF